MDISFTSKQSPSTTNQHQKNQKTKCVSDLYLYAETNNVIKLKQITDEQLFSGPSLNKALRKLILKYDSNDINYINSVDIIVSSDVDFKYKNENDNNSTVLMLISARGDLSLVKQILNANIEINEPFKIDFDAVDNFNRNFLHYIVYKNLNEDDAIAILDYFFGEVAPQQESIDKLIALLVKKDINGDVPLTIALQRGWFRMTQRILSIYQNNKITINNVNNTGNNTIHCAVIGNSVRCLKTMLSICDSDMIRAKNKEGLTPAMLASKMKYTLFTYIIDSYELNINNDIYKRSFEVKEISQIDLLAQYQNGNFEEVLSALEQLKMNNNVDQSKDLDFSLEWNILLTKAKLFHNNNKFDIQEKKPIGNLNLKNPPVIYGFEQFSVFFYMLTPSKIEAHLAEIANDDIPSLLTFDIIIYNKIVFYLRYNNINKVLETILFYLSTLLPVNDNVYYKWIMHVNVTLILIEIFIVYGYKDIVNVLIEAIEEFLFTTYNFKNDLTYSKDNEKVYEYLNESEILNQFSPTWDESFCYVNLLKTMNDVDNNSKALSHYKILIKKCKYINELKIFKRLRLFYISLKIKKNYFSNYTKCFKKLDSIKNEHSISDESLVFYYNSLGIIHLKLKKFSFAELQFKNALMLYKKLYNDKNISQLNVTYISTIKFNLALSLFYQKKFTQAKTLLEELTKVKTFNMNYAIWYRLGLCCLELSIEKLSKNKRGYNDIVRDLKGFDTTSLSKPSQQDCISIDLNEDNSSEHNEDVDDLYVQFEKEYGSGNNNSTNSNSHSSMSENDKNSKHIHRKRKDFERYILHYKEEKNNTELINEAISSFRQCIILSNYSFIKKENVISLMDFYTKNRSDKNYKNERKINYSMIINAYLNLLFCYSLNSEWLKMNFVLNEISKRQLPLSSDQKIKLENFRIESLINLNKIEEAQSVISKSLDSYANENYKFDFYSKGNCSCYNDISFKLNLHYGMCIISIKQNNLKKAEENLENIINNYVKDKNNLPSFVIQLMIYINIVKYNSEEENKEIYYANVINLIKTKKTDYFLRNNNNDY